MVGMLMFVNLALGIVSRVAPQINIFAVGFPDYIGCRVNQHRCNLADAGPAIYGLDGAINWYFFRTLTLIDQTKLFRMA